MKREELTAKVAISTTIAISLVRLYSAFVAIGVIYAKPLAVSLTTILAISDNIAFVTLNMYPHLAVHRSVLLIFHHFIFANTKCVLRHIEVVPFLFVVVATETVTLHM